MDRLSFCFYAYMQPGSDWHDVLILSSHVGWLLSLYAALRLKFSCEGYWLDCPIAVSARKLVVQFCSLTGAVFLSGMSIPRLPLCQLYVHFRRMTIFRLVSILPVLAMRYMVFSKDGFDRDVKQFLLSFFF